ncbi:MlaA family lipoprotein [Luteimonas aquatica]|uniref:MlaA family lipoprotein n=1 Tax=Luteimonas aquatica TaxID=450364 RepID=UPI001F55D747|nr:MlaA family lipoprotein [Luteimonas aquatica]
MNPLTFLRHAGGVSLLLLASACASQGGAHDGGAAGTEIAPTATAEAPATTAPDTSAAVAADTTAAEAPAVDAPDPAAQQDASTAAAAPTQAEQDSAAIYGTPPPAAYDPVADATLPAPAEQPQSYDPWEKWNRKVHRFNSAVDRGVAKPLAKAYVKVVPRPVRLGVSNFFNNLGQPVSAFNALLQGKPKQAWDSLGRFLINSTIGIGGIFDPATRGKVPNKSEDFGQTLGVWGWQRSRYVELPLFGPRTVRDTFGLVGDAPLSPLRQVENDKARVFLQGLQLVDVRTKLFAVDELREGAADDYSLVRDAWMQRRNYQIFNDSKREQQQGSALPDYLQDDQDNPTVPVDAMPLVPGSAVP